VDGQGQLGGDHVAVRPGQPGPLDPPPPGASRSDTQPTLPVDQTRTTVARRKVFAERRSTRRLCANSAEPSGEGIPGDATNDVLILQTTATHGKRETDPLTLSPQSGVSARSRSPL
jgi:hypothetical protein